MPTINITMGGSAVGASAGDGVVDVTVGFAGNYTDAEAVSAMDGATITPGQVGTPDDPVGETYTESGYVDELSVGSDGPATSFSDIAGDLHWIEDGNSPVEMDNEAPTITFATQWDEVLLRFEAVRAASNTGLYPNLQINDHTEANYRFVDETGRTDGETSFQLCGNGSAETLLSGGLYINTTTDVNGRGVMVSSESLTTTPAEGLLRYGSIVGSDVTPVTDVTLTNVDGGFNGTIRVYGRKR